MYQCKKKKTKNKKIKVFSLDVILYHVIDAMDDTSQFIIYMKLTED